MSKLPPSWSIVRLTDIASKGQYGWTTKAVERGEIKLLRTTDITGKEISWETVPYCLIPPDDIEKYELRVGDIVISRAGSVGYSTLITSVPERTVFASYLIRFVPSDEISARYLSYFLQSQDYWTQITKASAGNAVANVNATKLAGIKLPLAPFNEQERIADKLGKIFARLDACQERLDHVKLILDRFRQSILVGAISGDLTKDWRDDKRITLDSWSIKSGEEVFSYITSGSRGWAKYYAKSGATFLRVGNLSQDSIKINLNDVQYVDLPPGVEGKRTRIGIGDILISITADVGRIAYIDENIGEAYINQHLCLARQNGRYSGLYLAYYLASPVGGRGQLADMQRGVTKAGVTLGNIKELVFKIPERSEQDEIAGRIEALLSFADNIEAHWRMAHNRIEQLTPAILDKAFRGKLVLQDPMDEPASIMIERIRLKREKEVDEPRKRKPQRLKRTKMTKATAKEAIDQFVEDIFSFDDLHNSVPGDYEELKEIVFSLLGGSEPNIRQVFEPSLKAMRFVRSGK